MKLKEIYQKEIAKKLQTELCLTNIWQVPHLRCVKVNLGIGSLMKESKDYSGLEKNLALITGQKPALRRAHKSISNFKLRKGMPVGLMVTLRGERMFDFVERLIGVVLPRIRDFRGISKRSFDGRGNYSLGMHDQSVFPEINPDEAVKNRGLEITFVTTAQTNEAGEKLLSAFGFPFKK